MAYDVRYLNKFSTLAEYNSSKAQMRLLRPNVSWIEDEKRSVYNLKTKLFDYVYEDGTFSQELFTDKKVVGLVVIPQGHIDDKCRIMSINNMQELTFTAVDGEEGSYTVSENTGATSENSLMKWYKTNSGNQTKFQSTDVVNIYPDNSIKGVGSGSSNYFPKYDGTVQYIVEGYNDGNPYMWNYGHASATDGAVPSPFMNVNEGSSLSDTAPNPMYVYSNEGATSNSLKTIASGSVFTDRIINFSSGGVTSQVSGVTVAQDCPAASACRAYNPIGTGFHFGEWYLPTLAELGYVYFNMTAINTRLSKVGHQITSNWFWSSSEYNTTNAWRLNFSSGQANNNTKGLTNRVRAFLAF